MQQDASMVPLSHGGEDARQLVKAIRQDSSLEPQEGRLSLDDFLIAQKSLGDLGQGVLVKARLGSQYCGVTGNCPFWLYLIRNGRYEQVLGAENDVVGWAFALVHSSGGIPYLIIMGNAGGGHQTLVRFGVRHGRFVEDGCEDLTAKNPEAGADWFDASQVNIAPCDAHNP